MLDLLTIEADLARAEAQVSALRPGCEKRISWAGEPATKTAVSLLYIHGFSATGEELRPLPDLVAEGLGANLHFTRLSGHGQDGPAMGRATFQEWTRDVAEAIAVAQTIGDEVIIMGCSTGCTLATLTLAGGAPVKAMVHVSPNFGLRHRAVQFLLDLPGSRHWAKYVAGRERNFPVLNEAHAKYWTVTYPTKAVHVMADAVRAARRADLSQVTTPALFCFNADDQVVHPDQIRTTMVRWGGPVDEINLIQTPDDDEMGHVMAGNVFSPGQTLPLARRILAWVHSLPAS
ncbi:alpha/beta hydrolase [Loktanella sp. Alg231-35]|uniref:alpha/beta hydrolase n=1 Tax=Loktanella sp. Alg231-35 TaxID=1922220 RepID=UPI00131F27D0|nr:alpha/beta fold hydrolase [Loktanella sp. Alg231-35]